MPKKGFCAKCKQNKFLIAAGDTLCRDCAPKDQKEPEAAQVMFDLAARHAGTLDAAINSLSYLKLQKVPAMYVGEMTLSSRGFGTLVPADMPWATKVAEVLTNNFLCTVGGVFAGLVIFEGSAMVFTPPGQSEHGVNVNSPSISIMSLAAWQARLGCGNVRDWTCVLCHELIHYLHWRWTILPCDPKYNDRYEDQVSGQLAPGQCQIPGFAIKEANGLKELQSPPVPFTENGFRAKYRLAPRATYSDLSQFGK